MNFPAFQWERCVQLFLAAHSPQRLLRVVNICLADTGVILLALPPLMWWGGWKQGVGIILAILVSGGWVEDFLKNLVQRGRPRDPNEWGLPSGDCVVVTAWAVPLLGWWAAIPIGIVAWARVALGAHWPLDTLAGVALGGWLIGFLLI